MSNKEKGKNIYIGLPPSSNKVYLNIVIGRYSNPKNQVYKKSPL